MAAKTEPSSESAEELITRALTNGLGRGCEVERIECLDAHLQGHAFKYCEKSARLLGVYPYRITYRVASASRRPIDVMVKAKPDEDEILRVYQGLLKGADIALRGSLVNYLRNSDYQTPNLKEAVLFRDFAEPLSPFLPRSWGVYLESATGYTLRLEEKLVAGSIILSPDDDTTERWAPDCSDLTLRGIARIHARFSNNYQSLLDTGYFYVCDTEVMTQARELWQSLYDFLAQTYPAVMTKSLAKRHQQILDTLDDWYPQVDRQAKTLLYGDVNPQNLAFAKTGDDFQLSVFDWERALIGLPQRDLAEHLIYTLPDDFKEQDAKKEIGIYREAFAAEGAISLSDADFLQGLVWMLYDLILNRLPLMLVVKHVAQKRRHSDAAYLKAHRLAELLR